ncbi:MAG: 16S rRNA (guanine(527)-N(7))-methyltransferase RsmG [Bacteroidaceae bacterium]|nr:16S rRNA (guanine(527)-N(7))-methyltransferase RsmG [Bacteroidaceae bacterium]
MNQQLERLFNYFPDLTPLQQEQLTALQPLYEDWNGKINVISRKDIDNLYTHHVLHSLGIAKVLSFRPETRVLDVGTGGGFPGIPLAIMFPEVQFRLIDSIGKKVRVAQTVAEAIGLQNVSCFHRNVIEEKDRFHFVVSRAVTDMAALERLVRKNVDTKHQFNALPNGIIALKGGDLQSELKPFSRRVDATPLSQYFTEEFFETKQVVFVQV